jgi:hypothetical protein
MRWWAVILGLSAACAGRTRSAERQDPFSESSLERAVKRVVPLVERAAGRPFLDPPVVALATPEVLAKMVREEEELISSVVLRDTPAEVRAARAEAHAEGVDAGGLLGKYGIFEDTLYLCEASIAEATVQSGRPTADVADVAAVVLAHELTHALHDQHGDLERIVRDLADQDALWAASGTWEGLATWVSERVAEELELTDAFTMLAALQGWSPAGLEETDAYPVWATYGRGRDAIAWHFDRGGFDQVWAVAATPPRSSSGVFRPERWAEPRPAPDLDYGAVLRGTEQVLTKGDWVVGISALGEFELRGEAVVGDNEAELDAILAHLAQSWQLTGTRPDRGATVRVLRFDDPSWALRYLDALRQQQTADAARLATAVGREIEVDVEPLDIPGDAAILRHARVAGLGGTVAERHAAWVVRGDTAVVVSAESFRPGLRLQWAVEAVFERLETARAEASRAESPR